MTESPQHSRSSTRPFAGGLRGTSPLVAPAVPPRPFPWAARRARRSAPEVLGLEVPGRATPAPTPGWSVAVYAPGMAKPVAPEGAAPALEQMPGSLEVPLALTHDAPAVAWDAEAAAVLESVAQRMRAGEIQLPAGPAPRTEAEVIAAVLAALMGDLRQG